MGAIFQQTLLPPSRSLANSDFSHVVQHDFNGDYETGATVVLATKRAQARAALDGWLLPTTQRAPAGRSRSRCRFAIADIWEAGQLPRQGVRRVTGWGRQSWWEVEMRCRRVRLYVDGRGCHNVRGRALTSPVPVRPGGGLTGVGVSVFVCSQMSGQCRRFPNNGNDPERQPKFSFV